MTRVFSHCLLNSIEHLYRRYNRDLTSSDIYPENDSSRAEQASPWYPMETIPHPDFQQGSSDPPVKDVTNASISVPQMQSHSPTVAHPSIPKNVLAVDPAR